MDAQTKVDNTQLIESRMGLYRLFRRLFETEVDADFLAFVKRNELNEINAWLEADKKSLALDDDNQLITELAAEYAFLFVGPGPHLPPYESVYVGKEKVLNGQSTADVRRFILAAGFDFNEKLRRYPDHICSEMEFMERLLSHQLTAMKQNNCDELEKSFMLQQEFFRLHLSNWLPIFCRKIIEKGNLNFYRKLAETLLDFLRDEGRRLSVTTLF